MQRCHQCEASMTKDEKECLSCGAAVKVPPKPDARTRFRVAIKAFFWFSAGLTILSILTPWGPPVLTGACVTMVLLLVKSSMDEMLIDREK